MKLLLQQKKQEEELKRHLNTKALWRSGGGGGGGATLGCQQSYCTLSSAAWKLFRDWSKDLNCSSNLPTVLKRRKRDRRVVHRRTDGPQTDRCCRDRQVVQRQTIGAETDMKTRFTKTTRLLEVKRKKCNIPPWSLVSNCPVRQQRCVREGVCVGVCVCMASLTLTSQPALLEFQLVPACLLPWPPYEWPVVTDQNKMQIKLKAEDL